MRKAKCSYCSSTKPSSEDLPFFRRKDADSKDAKITCARESSQTYLAVLTYNNKGKAFWQVINVRDNCNVISTHDTQQSATEARDILRANDAQEKRA